MAAIDDPEDAVWELEGNVLARWAYRRGDVDAALAASAHTVHEVFQTQRVEHAFLEPESTLAVPGPDGTLKVFSGGQGVWDDRNQIAAVLGITTEQVIVEQVSNGGAFGGKEDMSNQAQTALAAWLLQPTGEVHAVTRGVAALCTPSVTRSAWSTGPGATLRAGSPRSKARMVGRLRAVRVASAMKVLERAAGHASGPYRLPAIDVESVAVRTNNPVCGAFRGFGANQAQFAMEGVMDRLAAEVGISGWEMRLRNAVDARCRLGARAGDGRRLRSGPRACLEAVKPAYDQAVADGKAVGLGFGLKNSGLGNGFLEIVKAVVRFSEDGEVEVRHCWTEMGQGVHTVALQVAVEELGVDPERVRVVVDTTPRARCRPDDRFSGDGDGRRRGLPTPAGARSLTGAARASTTRASTASTGPTRWTRVSRTR